MRSNAEVDRLTDVASWSVRSRRHARASRRQDFPYSRTTRHDPAQQNRLDSAAWCSCATPLFVSPRNNVVVHEIGWVQIQFGTGPRASEIPEQNLLEG